ncbi:MAG: chromate transporter [Rhodovarius sp.]|nr:chromate transporter [Rhodovarius sp.]MDW8315001.1 chromate transporter [Rhodovarius sp.]
MTPSWLEILGTFALLSLLAVGGANALAPEMFRLLVETRGWLDEASFVKLFALSQAAPGPNILAASVMGMAVAGLLGGIIATIGILGPAAILAWTVAGWLDRLKGAWWLKPAQGGLVPIAVGLMAAGGIILGEAAFSFWAAPLITAGTAAFVALTPRNPLWALLLGGLIGLAFAR